MAMAKATYGELAPHPNRKPGLMFTPLRVN